MPDKIKVEIRNWGFQDYKPGDIAEVEPHVARQLLHDGNGVEPEAKSSGKSSGPAS